MCVCVISVQPLSFFHGLLSTSIGLSDTTSSGNTASLISTPSVPQIRSGAAVDNAEIVRFAQLFNDALTLDNLERVQLVSMGQFVGINPFGTDQFLRNRLRAHLMQVGGAVR